MTTVEALKDLYVALGGDLADVQDMSTNVAVLNAISAKYEGADNAVLNPEAIANITAVAGNIGGGGESDFSTAKVTFINNASEHFILDGVNIFNDKMYPTLDSNDIDENPSTYLLFKGEGTIQPSFESNIVLTGTGNVTFSNMVGTITGDCTITITDVE